MVVSLVASLIGYSLMYFVNVSIATKTYSYPNLVFTKGPKNSTDSSYSGSYGCTDSEMTGDDVVGSLFCWHESHVLRICLVILASRG